MSSNDTAALVVALSAQVDKFQKDMDKANGIANRSVKAIEDRFEQANGVISSHLTAISFTASSQLGVVGNVLRTLGPAGIATAVGFGAAALAFKAMVDAAGELATKAKGIRDFAETTGLSTLQVQALSKAAAAVGVNSEEAEGAISKLTVNLDDLRKGTGTLREQLLRVNPALVDQLETATSTADAITILGKAFDNLDSTFQRNALAKAIGGRGGVSTVSRLFPGLDLNKLASDLEASGKALDENLIKKLPQLQLEIEKMSKKARENIISIFAEDVLERQKLFAQNQLTISEQIKNFKISDDFKALLSSITPTWIERLIQMLPVLRDVIAAPGIVAAPTQPSQRVNSGFQDAGVTEQATKAVADYTEQINQLEFARRKLGARLAVSDDPEEIKRTANAISDLDGRIKELKTSKDSASAPLKIEVAPSAAAQLQTFKDSISLRQDDLTLAEQQRLKQLEQNAAIEANQRVSVGAAAGMRQLTLSQQQLILAIKEQLGVATEQEITEVRLAALRDRVAKGYLTDAGQIAQAEAIIRKEAKETAEQMEVRASKLPQVTKYLQDARNASRGLDSVLANAFSSGENAFADFITGTKSASAAFSDLAKSIQRDLAKLVFRQLLGGLFGGAGIGDIFSKFLGGGKAGGGPVVPGRIYPVNENTPNTEFFAPTVPGTIIPNDVARRSTEGGLSASYIFHVAGEVSQSTVDRLERMVSRQSRSLAQLNGVMVKSERLQRTGVA